MVRGPRNRHPLGMSLAVVLAVVAVMAIIASTMAAVSMMSLNFTQRWYNASVALNEAEAGVSELLYDVADDPAFGKDGSREIRARLSEGYSDDECGHVVTFRKDGGQPYSVNNLDGASPEGYGGRLVPSKMVHVWSIGFCRGMYRTVEVLVEKPAFPYALATSGRIRSKSPLVVEGAHNVADYAAGKKARPGHIVANSTLFDAADPSKNAIYIRSDPANPDNQTFITGFAQSPGGIRIEGGEILGGLRPRSSKVTLPDIDVSGYRQAGQPGVISLRDAEWPLPPDGPFVLDVMYDREGDLRLNGPAVMRNAFLFVNGNLTIGGSLTGTGAVVVTGDVTVNGDAAISSDNRVALLSGGRVLLNGSGNFFQGLVYCRGGVTANEITVLGNMIVAGGSTSDASLDGVKLVSEQSASTLSFTARSSNKVNGGSSGKDGEDPGIYLGGTFSDQDKSGFYRSGYQSAVGAAAGNHGSVSLSDKDAAAKLQWLLTTGAVQDANGTVTYVPNGRIADFTLGPDAFQNMQPDAGEVRAAVQDMASAAETYQRCAEALKNTPPTIQEKTTDANGVVHLTEKPNPDYARLQQEQAAAKVQYDGAVAACVKAYMAYIDRHASSGMTYNGETKGTLDVTHVFSFDINQYLTEGARLKIVYWHVYGDKR